MASFNQSTVDLTNLLVQPESQCGSNPEKASSESNNSSPHSIFTSSNGYKELNSLHSGSQEISMSSTDVHIDGLLDITLHHANDIHNICIYGNQDVYAKFSITHTQDTVYSTQPVRGGGKNPVFNQTLQILISKLDTVLKCELWMMSCARNYLEDQLLGFVLVPLRDLMGMGKSTRDYALSSTDLFHTPAGTVCLSLMFYQRGADLLVSAMAPERVKLAVQESAVVSMENGKHGDWNLNKDTPLDYDSIEFPDLQVVSENQQLVSMYMKLASAADANMDESPCDGGDPPRQQDDANGVAEGHAQARDDLSMLQMGSLEGDCEMAVGNGGEEKDDACNGSSVCGVTDDTGMLGNGELSSPSTNQPISQPTRATASKEEVSGLKIKALKKIGSGSSSQATPSPRSASSGGGLSASDDKTISSCDGQESASSFTAPLPLVNIALDPEVPVVQQEIVDMYMKSMQQFTESLAKMKLPFDIEGTQSSAERKSETQSEKKGATLEDGHRVFYGSRAFF